MVILQKYDAEMTNVIESIKKLKVKISTKFKKIRQLKKESVKAQSIIDKNERQIETIKDEISALRDEVDDLEIKFMTYAVKQK